MKITVPLLLSVVIGAGWAELDKRILGGQSCDKTERLYHVEVETEKTTCGGSLLNTRWVITAAHCADGRTVTVKLDQHNNAPWYKKIQKWFVTEKQVIPVSQHFVYEEENKKHDIMLLKLSSDVSAKLPVIKLPTSGSCTVPAVGTEVRIGGWGAAHKEHAESNKQPWWLRCASIHIATCTTIDQDNKYQRDSQNTICAFKPGVDACPGDAGAAMEVGGVLYGVINSNPVDRCDGTVDIANICHYISWIEKTMAKNNY